MAGKQVAGDGVPPSLAGMSKNQLYDIMCQMKALIEQNHQQARQILIQNPALTRALFQAQIMLGMVQPPNAAPTTSPSVSHNSQQPIMPTQQSNIQAVSSFPVDQNQTRKQPSIQTVASKPQSLSVPPSNVKPQPPPSQSLQLIQKPKGQLGPKSTPSSVPQSPNLTQLPQHAAPASPPSLHQPSMPMSSLPIQSQQPQPQPQPQPLQNTGGQYLPLQPPLQPPQQPPLPPQPRPQIQPFSHQVHTQRGPNMGFQHRGGQQMHHSQPMFHTGTVPPAGLGPSYLQGQPPLPNHMLPPSLYQAGGPPLGMEFNQAGSSSQVDRGPSWIPGMPDAKGSHFPGPPLVAGPMGPINQPPRPPLTPEMEKALLQQVMSLTPEQINMLPADQRNQVLQLQQMLRQ